VGRTGWGDEMKEGADYSKPGGTKAVGRISSHEAQLGPLYVDSWNKEKRLGPLYKPREHDSQDGRTDLADQTECSRRIETAVMMERVRMIEREKLMERERWNRDMRRRLFYPPNWIREEWIGPGYQPHYRTHMDAPLSEEKEWINLKDEVQTFPPFEAMGGKCLFC